MKKLLIVALVFSLFLSCAKKEFYPKDIYYQGMKAYKEKKYDKAKDYLKKAIYKAKGMTTEDIMNAKFALANIYFHQKQYVDAIVEFEEYISMYPTAPNIPEALYKLAISYLKVSPDYQRDLTYVRKAEEKAKEIIINYPNSKYVEKAKEIIKKVKQIEIEHYKDIADLYEHLGKPYSAYFYYNFIYNKYYNYIDKDYIRYKMGINLLKTQQQYKDNIEDYKEKLKELEEKIKKEKNLDKKNVLQNRKKLLEEQLYTYEKRIKESKIKGKEILKELAKKGKYKKEIENILKKYN